MPPRPWEHRSAPHIAAFFNQTPPSVFKELELRKIFNQHRGNWQLPVSLTNRQLLRFLVDSSLMTEIQVASEKYRGHETLRYSWKNASPFSIANSLRPSSFLAYSSAAYIHGLTDEEPKTFYLNKEQSPKPPNDNALQQSSIDRAFKGKQRKSEMILSWDEHQTVVINGKNSGRLGVVDVEISNGSKVDVTNLERTLLDMTVRPAYSGGVSKVLEAFEKAKGILKASLLDNYLKELDYTYPYHQSIGFYLQKAGYPSSAVSRFSERDITHNFYLDYGLKKPAFIESWKLYIPQHLA